MKDFPPIIDTISLDFDADNFCSHHIAERLGLAPLWDPAEIANMDSQTTFKRDVRIYDQGSNPIEMTIYAKKEMLPGVSREDSEWAAKLGESQAWRHIHLPDRIIAVHNLDERPTDEAIRALGMNKKGIALTSENDHFFLVFGAPHSAIPTGMTPLLHVHSGEDDSSLCPSREDYLHVFQSKQTDHYLLFSEFKRNYRIHFWAEPTSLP